MTLLERLAAGNTLMLSEKKPGMCGILWDARVQRGLSISAAQSLPVIQKARCLTSVSEKYNIPLRLPDL